MSRKPLVETLPSKVWRAGQGAGRPALPLLCACGFFFPPFPRVSELGSSGFRVRTHSPFPLLGVLLEPCWEGAAWKQGRGAACSSAHTHNAPDTCCAVVPPRQRGLHTSRGPCGSVQL